MKCQNKVTFEKRQNQRTIRFERAKRNTRRGVSQGVYQAALNDQTVVDRILTTVKRKLQRITWSTRTRYTFEKRQNQRTISFERAKRNTGRGVSQRVYQSAVNDQAGSRSHTHYSQTEITTHHMEYQNKVQL